MSGAERTSGSAERLEELEAELVRALPGASALERSLEVDGRRIADLVARERAGRLVLVRLAPHSADEAVLAALDLLSSARSGMDLVLRHLEALGRTITGATAREAPRTILVLPQELQAERALARRLDALVPAGLERATRVTARSAGGTSSHLVVEGSRSTAATRHGVDSFLAVLAPARRELALLALRRLERVDQDLERRTSVEALAFRQEGRSLCELLVEDGELVGRLADGQRLELRAGQDLDRFLERVLETLVTPGDGVSKPERRAVANGHAPVTRAPRESALLARAQKVSLTPEELAAFRD